MRSASHFFATFCDRLHVVVVIVAVAKMFLFPTIDTEPSIIYRHPVDLVDEQNTQFSSHRCANHFSDSSLVCISFWCFDHQSRHKSNALKCRHQIERFIEFCDIGNVALLDPPVLNAFALLLRALIE